MQPYRTIAGAVGEWASRRRTSVNRLVIFSCLSFCCFVSCLYLPSCAFLIAQENNKSAEPEIEAFAELATASQPQLAVDSEGRVFCVFGKGDGVFIVQCKEGKTTQPVLIGRLDKLALGRRRGPQVCVSGGALVVSAISHQTGQIVSWRSLDQGENWSPLVAINTIVNDVESGQKFVPIDSAKEGLHAMAVSGSNGHVVCLWLDFRNQKMELYAAVSQDEGESWGENIKVYAAPEKNICECCHPSLAFDSEGGLHVMWRNSIGGNRDMYHLYSKDLITFTKARQLGILSWKLDQCPMDGGSIAAVSAKEYYTVWRRDNVIYRSNGPAKEDAFGVGQQPVVVLLDGKPNYLWIGRNGELKWSTPERFSALRIAEKAHEPVAAAYDGGLLIAFETRDEENQPMVKILKLNLNQ